MTVSWRKDKKTDKFVVFGPFAEISPNSDVVVTAKSGTTKKVHIVKTSNTFSVDGEPYFNGVHVGLGCVKFGSELIARFPRAFDEVAKMHDIKHPAKHWCRLDSWLQDRVLPTRERHIHEPSVGHLKETPKMHPSHGCL